MRPWQSREGTGDSHRPPLKWYAPIASVAALSERHGQLQIWRHSRRMCNASKFVIARPQRGRGNLGKAVSFSPMAFQRSGYDLRDCTPRALPRASRSGRHVGLRPPRNDKLENFTPQNVCRKDCQPAWRSLSAATDAIGAYRFNGGRYGLHVQRRARLSAPLHRTAEGLRIIHSSVFIFHMSLLFPCRFTDSQHSAACLPGRRAGFPR